MAVTCHSYSLRTRSSPTEAACGTDRRPKVAATKKREASSSGIRIRGDVREVNAHMSSMARKDDHKVKGSKRRIDRQENSKELDIEDVPKPSEYEFSKEEIVAIKTNLLDWYDDEHRILPWRQNLHSRRQKRLAEQDDEVSFRKALETKASGDSVSRPKENARQRVEDQRAYEVWVSEIMLQQTGVSTVIGYYRRWMEKWPTILHLSQASQEEVNSVWAGLGYYRRARFLLEGAKEIERSKTGFPRTVEDLKRVPGIGQYTAGAIASIAYQQPVPVVDGNIIRVLSRLRALSENPKLATTVKIHWALAKALVDVQRPGDLNQSLMELGATVCTPTKPSCSSCPVSTCCRALSLESRSLNVVTDFPAAVAKVQRRNEYVVTCILILGKHKYLQEETERLVADSKVLLVQRSKQGLLAGLWEFPQVSLGAVGVSEEQGRAAMDKYLQDYLGFNLSCGTITRREALGTHVHLFSHIKMYMSVEWLFIHPADNSESLHDLNKKLEASVSTKWVHADELPSLGLTSSVRKVYTMLLNHLKTSKLQEKSKIKKLKP